MRIVAFPQFDEFVAEVASRVGASAEPPPEARYALVSPRAEGGVVRLRDRAMNSLDADGDVVLSIPAGDEGLARDFLVRVRAGADAGISFAGAHEFESDNPDALSMVAGGTTALIYFTETAPGVFAVARKTVERILA